MHNFLDPDERVFPCPIQSIALAMPDKIALIEKEANWSYQQLDLFIHAIGKELKARNLPQKAKVAFFATPCINTIALLFALLRMQYIACPLSSRLPLQQKKELCARLEVDLFVSCEEVESFSSLSPSAFFPSFLDKEQKALFLFTSGSSGKPKAACLSVGNLYWSALGSNHALCLDSSHRWLLSLPLFHVSGISILWRSFLVGATIVLPSFSPKNLFLDVLSQKVSHLSLVPTQLFRLLQENLPFVEKIANQTKAILVGGSLLSSSIARKAYERALPILPTYGMTEMSAQITMQERKLTSCSVVPYGKPLLYREMCFSPEGEILVRGKTLFQGYADKENTLFLPLEDGWFATKDLGTWSQENEVILWGRKDNLFIYQGENIYPEEIEQALLSLPYISEAIVVSYPDIERGDIPVAFVRYKNKIPSSLIQQELRSCLLPFKIPHYFLPFPEEADEEGKRRRSELKLHAAVHAKKRAEERE